MLRINEIDVFYGKVQALYGVSLEADNQEIVTIIGANGAGKSTIMKSIMGVVRPAAGSIVLNDTPLHTLKTHNIVNRRVVLIPEGREIFPMLSVLENLEMGAYSRNYTKVQFEERLDEVYGFFPRLKEREHQKGGTLSGGEQQMLTIARGLMSEPAVLMLDEPSLGLAPVIVEDMFEIIVRINKEKHIPILLVEQNAYMALSIASRGYVLENGRIVTSGDAQELLRDPEVKVAYLGG